MSAEATCVRPGRSDQQLRNRVRGLAHGVVGAGDVVDPPCRVGQQPGAQACERRAVLPSGAVDEIASGYMIDGAGKSDRLHERGKRVGAPAGIAAVRGAERGADGVARVRCAGHE